MLCLCNRVVVCLALFLPGYLGATDIPINQFDDSCITESFEGVVIDLQKTIGSSECQLNVAEPETKENEKYKLVSIRSEVPKESKPGDSCQYVATFCQSSEK